MSGKAILMCLIPIMVGVIYDDNICPRTPFKVARSVTMNFFRKKCFLFKSFVKVELSYDFTINLFSTAENCM